MASNDWRFIDDGPMGAGGQIWVAYPNPKHPDKWNLIVEWTPLAHPHLTLHSGCMWRPVDVPQAPEVPK